MKALPRQKKKDSLKRVKNNAQSKAVLTISLT